MDRMVTDQHIDHPPTDGHDSHDDDEQANLYDIVYAYYMHLCNYRKGA
jgi:hypothetical protein